MNALAPITAHEAVQRRLDEIERALKFDPDPSYRRELIREYLALTDKEKTHG